MPPIALIALSLAALADTGEPAPEGPDQVVLPWEAATAPCPPGTVAPEPGQPCRAELPRGPVVLDGIVAVVGDRIVMASDVALERALAARDPSPVAVLQRRRSDPLSFLVDLAVIRGLAGQITVYQPSDDDVATRLDRLRATWSDPASYQSFLRAHGLDEARLSGVLFSRMVVEHYVQRNVGFAAEAAGDTPAEYDARYADWIGRYRQDVIIREVAASELP